MGISPVPRCFGEYHENIRLCDDAIVQWCNDRRRGDALSRHRNVIAPSLSRHSTITIDFFAHALFARKWRQIFMTYSLDRQDSLTCHRSSRDDKSGRSRLHDVSMETKKYRIILLVPKNLMSFLGVNLVNLFQIISYLFRLDTNLKMH